MVLTGPLDDGLPALVVGSDAEGRILGRKRRQRLAHLLLVALGLGLDGDLDQIDDVVRHGHHSSASGRRRDGYDLQPERLKEDIEDHCCPAITRTDSIG
jgi:hypothetical protein